MPILGALYDGVDLVFLCSAILGAVALILRAILGAFGMDHHDVAADAPDLPVGGGFEHSGLQIFSIHGMTSFFLMFGLGGLVCSRSMGWSDGASIIGATVCGLAMMFVIAKLMQMLMGMQSAGNISLSNTVGAGGTVYLGIPAGGVGQVQVTIQHRMTVVDARAEDGDAIPTGRRVLVVAVLDGATLQVRQV